MFEKGDKVKVIMIHTNKDYDWYEEMRSTIGLTGTVNFCLGREVSVAFTKPRRTYVYDIDDLEKVVD